DLNLAYPSLPSPPLFSTMFWQFSVVGPHRPILAKWGEDAELPCQLYPKTNAEHMEIRWYRSNDSRLVHLYPEGKDQESEQMPEFQGRTTLIRDAIAEGRVALRIHRVRVSDQGSYTCRFQSSIIEEAVLELGVIRKSLASVRQPVLYPLPRAAPPKKRALSMEREEAGWRIGASGTGRLKTMRQEVAGRDAELLCPPPVDFRLHGVSPDSWAENRIRMIAYFRCLLCFLKWYLSAYFVPGTELSTGVNIS
uniref:Ig-like domain-containing protein n=1 Tax=Ornithorhynchus anatinus TaxID=9258 RepID=F6RHH8_ORNAN